MLELDHPHIIKLLDFFEERDNYFMVVEKVNGELVRVEKRFRPTPSAHVSLLGFDMANQIIFGLSALSVVVSVLRYFFVAQVVRSYLV